MDEIEKIKHIGSFKDGELVCDENCPSITHHKTDRELKLTGTTDGKKVERGYVEVAPNIFQSKEDFEANHQFDEARDNKLTDNK